MFSLKGMINSWLGRTKADESSDGEYNGFEGIPFGLQQFAGMKVDHLTAMQHDAVFTCVRDKAESLGIMPLQMYRAKRGKTELVTSGREHRIFTQKPNDFQTMQDFVEMAETWLELRGQFFAYVNYNKYGNVSEIVPFFNQLNVMVNKDVRGVPYYTYVTNDGTPSNNDLVPSRNIMHIKLFSLDGLNGCSPIRYNTKALGISMAQENYLGSLMENGALTKGFLSTEHEYKDETVLARVKAQWKKNWTGTHNAGKAPILEGGMKYHAMSISPADAELIMQRKMSRSQIFGMFRVPKSRDPAAEEKVGSRSIEQENMLYLQTGLMPPARKIEAALSAVMGDGLSVKFNTMEFLRGDMKTMQEVLGNTFKLGAISMNELRTGLGWEEKEGGDVHAIDTNNLTFGYLTDIPKLQEETRRAAQAAQANKPSSESTDEDQEDE